MEYEVIGLDEVGIVGITSGMYSAFILNPDGTFRKNGGAGLSLYLHYFWTALRQDTNQPRATDGYCMKGLGWGRDKLRSAKAVLIDMGVVEYLRKRDEKGVLESSYVRLKYLKSHPQVVENPHVDKPTRGEQPTNASLNKRNASLNKEKTLPAGMMFDFNDFWKIYPKKRAKAQALKTWIKLYPSAELAIKIIQSVSMHISYDESWKKDNGQYIPYPSTYLNQGAWEDELEGDTTEGFDPSAAYKQKART